VVVVVLVLELGYPPRTAEPATDIRNDPRIITVLEETDKLIR